MITDEFLDQYEFTCDRCGYVWRETYDVRHLEDEQGGTWDHYSVAGVPTASPKARAVCRSCGQPTVHYRLVDRREVANVPVGITVAAHATPAPSAPPSKDGKPTSGTASADDVLERLGASREGFSSDEAQRMLASVGPNAIAEERRSLLSELGSFFWGPIPWMIEVADVLSAILRHWDDVASS